MTTLVNTPPAELPPLMRVGDVANLLSVSKTTVHKLIDAGDLTAARINPEDAARNHIRVTRKSLLGFYEKRFGHCLLRALSHGYKS